MAELAVSIIANIGGVKIPWEQLSREKQIEVATRLNDDAMTAVGYKKCSGQFVEERPEHSISA